MSLSPKGTDNQLVFLTESKYWDKSSLVKFALALCFSLGIFLFFHYCDLGTEPLVFNAEAPNFVVAQADFTYRDVEATHLAKEESLKDIEFIRAVNELDCTQKLDEFKCKLDASPLRQDRLYVEEIKHVAENLIRQLTKVIFVSESTRDLMKHYGLATDHCIGWNTGKDDALERLPRFIWDEVERMSVLNHNSNYSLAAKHCALDAFSHVRWQIEVDTHYQGMLRRCISNDIAPIVKTVRAGATIIEKGETVTQRHIDMNRAMTDTLLHQRRLNSWQVLCTLPLIIISTAFGGMYLWAFQSEAFRSNRQLLLICLICLATLLLAKCSVRAFMYSSQEYMRFAKTPLITPFTAILTASLFSLRAAAFISAFITAILALGLPVDSSIFFPINFAGALVALMNFKRLIKRRALVMISLQIWTAASLTMLALDLYINPNALLGGDLPAKLAVNVLFVTATAILVVIALPILEVIFGIMTDMTLMDYLDPNSELLRRLSIEAPGTYQHSVFVSHLAECAALSINARALFCRVSGLYHDVGKLAYPHYFVENQRDINVHLLLTPTESAHAILGHVPEGVSLARQYHLPEPFVQIIKEHHGTGLVYYFYSCECDLLGDEAKVDKQAFRYKGPIPQSKESLIIMLCDSLEAISRSMEEVNDASVGAEIDKLISWFVANGQFSANVMSFQELFTVKKNLVKTLVAANHSRVKYQVKSRPAPYRSMLSKSTVVASGVQVVENPSESEELAFPSR